MPMHFPNIPATFIHVPKTGGTSFYKWAENNITDYLTPAEPNSFANGSVDGATGIYKNLGTVFSFTRNPYSRLVSMYFYHYNISKEYIKLHRSTKEMIESARTIAISSKGFDYWIEAVCLKKKELYCISDADPNKMTVTSWFCGVQPNIICRLENIEEDFKKIQDLLDCHATFPHENVTDHKHYREYYNSYTKSLVEEMFKEDLDNFNYDF